MNTKSTNRKHKQASDKLSTKRRKEKKNEYYIVHPKAATPKKYL